MTTPYQIEKMWPGETVAIIGNAPGMTAELATELANTLRPCRAIAVNRGIRFAPWADMLISIDGNWPEEGNAFAGLRIVGIESERDALYVPLPYERVTVAPGHVLELRNNALSAIRIAAQAGAARIVLAGFDTDRYEELHGFPGLTAGLAALTAELQAQGIVVEQALAGDGSGTPLPPIETRKRKVRRG